MEIVVTRKIKVVGCLNCPYVFRQSLSDKAYAYKCLHPSFNQGSPIIPINTVESVGENIDKVVGWGDSTFPSWCPLECDSPICTSTPIKC